MSSWLNGAVVPGYPNVLVIEVLQAQPTEQDCATCWSWSQGAHLNHLVLRDTASSTSAEIALGLVNTAMVITDRQLRIRWKGNAYESAQQQAAIQVLDTL